MDERGIRIGDLPGEAFSITDRELAAIWDGTAILVSSKPVSKFEFYTKWAIFDFLPLAGCITISLSVVFVLRKRVESRIFTSLSLILVAGILGALFRQFLPDGDLYSQYRIVGVAKNTKVLQTDEISSIKNAVLVDARYPSDFSAGHIENSINLPIFASDAEIRSSFKDVDRQDRIVVYCHSEKCSFSAIVAEKLVAMGYEHVLTMKKGWMEISAEYGLQK